MELWLISFTIGFVFILAFGLVVRYRLMRDARNEAQDIVQTAQAVHDDAMDIAKALVAEYRDEKEVQLDKELATIQERIDKNKNQLEETEQQLQDDFRRKQSTHDKKLNQFNIAETNFKETQQRYNKMKSTLSHLKKEHKETLVDLHSDSTDQFKEELKAEFIDEQKEMSNRWAQIEEQESQNRLDKTARSIILRALNRFQRPFCAERGIKYVHLVDKVTRDKMFGPDQQFLKLTEKECGVDLIYKEDTNSISVAGFDPVRRELARLTLQKLLRKNKLNESVITSTIRATKTALFQMIHKDGRKLPKELDLKPFSKEITNTMGSLRYRYSFAQNQYFHCAEVGHLCGLLASEIGENIKDAKRSGVLHDIGKAMDHSIDGGHAIIGADFIEKHGEEPHIVHAVKAHHYDEPPETDLAYLVIGADAISGSRPGARRSTADAYMQKIGQLESIGNSFEGVTDTYIMGAGREVRLIINNEDVTEFDVVDLSQRVAKKIEEECSYPGLIKVTVVRRTQAVEYAR